MSRLLRGGLFTCTVLLIVLSAVFFVQSTTASKTAYNTSSSTEGLIALTKTDIAEYPVAISTFATKPSVINNYFTYTAATELEESVTKLLPNIEWLINEHSSTANNKDTYFTSEHVARLERQIFRSMDDSSDSRSELGDSITQAGTFTDPTITGGSLANSLLINPTFSGDMELDGNLLVGTTTARELVTIDTGAIYLGDYTPTTTTNRLYSTAGDLYWAGSLLAGGSVGNWDSNGTDVYRQTGNVGIGTTTPGSELTVVGNVRITGALRDSNNSAGTAGFVLQSTGSGMTWVATSSLGISGSGGYSGGDLTVDGFVNISETSDGYNIGGQRVMYASSTNLSVAVGFGAGSSLRDTAQQNTAVGYGALFSATSSGYNTALGAGSLNSTTGGYENTATGYNAMYLNTTGAFNTVAGYNSLYSGQAGVFNTAFGHNSLYNNVTGAFNTVLGASAGYDVSTSNSVGANTLIGYNTGRGITTGVNNTILGANVTGLSATLSNNIIIADGAGNRRINIDSSGRVGIGTTTQTSLLTVAGSTTLGTLSIASGSAGGNTMLSLVGGRSYLQSDTTTSALTVVSEVSGATTQVDVIDITRRRTGSSTPSADFGGSLTFNLESFTDGVNPDAGVLTTAWEVNQTNDTTARDSYISMSTLLDNVLSEKYRVTSAGNFGIGTTSPTSKLTVAGSINSTDLLGGATTLSTDANGNIIRTPSDERLKTNVTDIEDALDTILGLRGVKYEWLDKERFGDMTEIGFLAQEVDPLIPEVVRKGGEYWTLNTPNMLAVVVEAIKEMWSTVQGHDERLDELESENESIKSENEAIKERLRTLEEELEVGIDENTDVQPETESENTTSEAENQNEETASEVTVIEPVETETVSESGEVDLTPPTE